MGCYQRKIELKNARSHTYFHFFLSVTFFTIIDHWVCVGSWLKTVQPHLSNCQEMKTPT